MLHIDKKCGKKVVKKREDNYAQLAYGHQEAQQVPTTILKP